MMINTTCTVSQLNFFIKSVLEAEPRLRHISVSGEISNFVEHYQSGHMYFTLKDSGGAIKAVMFRSNASQLKFRPEDGMSVVVTGRVSVYERSGTYQLYAESMVPDGAGALAEAFARLKEKLGKEGLFDKKKPIPRYPSRIGVITGENGAAVRDIFHILSRRWPLSEIVFAPVLVQGVGASKSMVEALTQMNQKNCCDVIILGRGGGSAEDLWAFNEEPLVRAVAASKIPVISAVGHETDFTLCDFAADLRAPTPSAAAELAVPDQEEEMAALKSLSFRLQRNAKAYFAQQEAVLRFLSEKTNKRHVLDKIANDIQYCDSFRTRLKLSIDRKTENLSRSLAMQMAALDALSPLKVLSRGYAICERDGVSISSVVDLKEGEQINLRFSDGRALCDITQILDERRAPTSSTQEK